MALPQVMKPRMPGDSGIVVVARTRPLGVVAEGGFNGMTALWACVAGPPVSCCWVSRAPLGVCSVRWQRKMGRSLRNRRREQQESDSRRRERLKGRAHPVVCPFS